MLVLVVVLASASGDARAHLLQHPKRLRVTLERTRVVLDVDYELAPGAKVQELRQAFDRDHSGRLDAQEQGRLLEFLVGSARAGTHVFADVAQEGWKRWFTTRLEELVLAQEGGARWDRLDDVADSTALLAVHLRLVAPLPPGNDWRGRRFVHVGDVSSGAEGHVPAEVVCVGCEILASSAGVSARDPRGDRVLGVELGAVALLKLVVGWR